MKFNCFLEDAQGVEYRLIVDVEIEPAQNGGMTDPSWPASWAIWSAKNDAGRDVLESLSVDECLLLDLQVTQHFENLAKD